MMNKLVIDGKDIYSNLHESTVCKGDISGKNTIIKSQKVNNLNKSSLNENGDYACKSPIILEGLILSLLGKINSSHFPKFINMSVCNRDVYLEMEKIKGYSLFELKDVLTDDEKDVILFQVLYSLYQTEVYEFSHGNLSEDNIMIENVEEQVIEYVLEGNLYKMSNLGINVKLIDFEFSRMTIYKTYIFNENMREQYYPLEYDVLYNPSNDIYKLLSNQNLISMKMSEKNLNIPKVDAYNTIAMLFDLPIVKKSDQVETINEIKTFQRGNLIGEDEIPYYIAEYPLIKDPSIKDEINYDLYEIFKYLLDKKYNRLVYKFLTYFPKVPLIYHNIEPGMESYTNNRKLINKMKEIINNKDVTNFNKQVKLFNTPNIPIVEEDKVINEEAIYDPIMLEYVNIEDWFQDENNIIFYLTDLQIGSNRNYFKQIQDTNILVDVVLSNNVINYNRTLKSAKYVNLNKYGINAVIEYNHFINAINSGDREFNIINSGENILGINYEGLLHNPKTYETKYINNFENKRYNSLKNYTFKWDNAINKYLRSNKNDEEYLNDKEFLKYYREFGDYPEEALETIKETIKNMDEAFIESFVTSNEFVLFRGTKDCILYDGLNLGFISTSKSFKSAQKFTDGNGCIYEMHIAPGIPYIYMESLTIVKGEEEILLPRNLITSLRERKGNLFIVDIFLSKEDQFIFSKEYLEYPISKIEGYEDVEINNYIKCFRNTVENGEIIDEITGDIIDENNSINNNGMCYNKSTLVDLFNSYMNNEEIENYSERSKFIDPFTQVPFSDDIIFKIMDLLINRFDKDELIEYFILLGYLNVVKYLLENIIDINTLNFNILSVAVKSDDLELIEYFVGLGIDTHDNNGNYLNDASEKGYFDIVKYLFEQGIDVKIDQALVVASANGHLEIVKYLVEYGANVNTQNDDSLLLATSLGKLEVVEYLIDHGANVHANNDKIIIDAVKSGNLKLIKYLVEHGANVHILDDQVIVHACGVGGNLDIVKYLVEEHNIDVHSQDDKALIIASRAKKFDIVQYLVDHGANVHAQDDKALIVVSSNGSLKIVKYLVEHGADIHAQNDHALINASSNGNLQIVKYLIDNGATIKDETILAAYRYPIIEEYLTSHIKK